MHKIKDLRSYFCTSVSDQRKFSKIFEFPPFWEHHDFEHENENKTLVIVVYSGAQYLRQLLHLLCKIRHQSIKIAQNLRPVLPK